MDYYELFLTESAAVAPETQRLQVLIRDIERRGTPAMKEFLNCVLAAARNLARS